MRAAAIFGGVAALACALLAAPAGATFPGQNGRIVFDDGGQIATINPDGSNRQVLTTDGGNSDPAFSADGKRIVYSHSTGPRRASIYVMRADGTGQRAVTKDHFDNTPAFSPNGRKIVFSRVLYTKQYQHSEIFTVRSNGKHVRQLTHNKPVFQERRDQPSYSPNGKKIAFEGVEAEDAGIGLMKSDGRRWSRKTSFPDGALEPSFGPGGHHILFNDSLFHDPPQIGITDGVGRGGGFLTDNADRHLTYHLPSYSPDGSMVVYSTGGEYLPGMPRGDIVVMNVDGTGSTQLTNDGTSIAPDWGPLPVD